MASNKKIIKLTEKVESMIETLKNTTGKEISNVECINTAFDTILKETELNNNIQYYKMSGENLEILQHKDFISVMECVSFLIHSSIQAVNKYYDQNNTEQKDNILDNLQNLKEISSNISSSFYIAIKDKNIKKKFYFSKIDYLHLLKVVYLFDEFNKELYLISNLVNEVNIDDEDLIFCLNSLNTVVQTPDSDIRDIIGIDTDINESETLLERTLNLYKDLESNVGTFKGLDIINNLFDETIKCEDIFIDKYLEITEDKLQYLKYEKNDKSIPYLLEHVNNLMPMINEQINFVKMNGMQREKLNLYIKYIEKILADIKLSYYTVIDKKDVNHTFYLTSVEFMYLTKIQDLLTEFSLNMTPIFNIIDDHNITDSTLQELISKLYLSAYDILVSLCEVSGHELDVKLA